MKRNPDVTEWFAARERPLAEAMQKARAIILGAEPRVTETIKWNTPTFAYEGNIVSFMPAKKLVSLMFHRGAEVPGKHPRLVGDGKLVRTMRFASVAEVEAGRRDLEAVVKAWCRMQDEAATGKKAASGRKR